jgi:hypothetical protein
MQHSNTSHPQTAFQKWTLDNGISVLLHVGLIDQIGAEIRNAYKSAEQVSGILLGTTYESGRIIRIEAHEPVAQYAEPRKHLISAVVPRIQYALQGWTSDPAGRISVVGYYQSAAVCSEESESTVFQQCFNKANQILLLIASTDAGPVIGQLISWQADTGGTNPARVCFPFDRKSVVALRHDANEPWCEPAQRIDGEPFPSYHSQFPFAQWNRQLCDISSAARNITARGLRIGGAFTRSMASSAIVALWRSRVFLAGLVFSSWSIARKFITRARTLQRKQIGLPIILARAPFRPTALLKVALFISIGVLVFSSRFLIVGAVDDVRGRMRERAALQLDVSFAAGLSEWTGGGQLVAGTSDTRPWALKPGAISLYKPSRRLSNYELTFRTVIDSNGVGWVVRALDARNYQAIRLISTGPRTSPAAVLIHYAVINGAAAAKTTKPVRFQVAPGQTHEIATVVNEESVVVSIDGEFVDSWKEDAFGRGGFGFFAERGERAIVFGIRASDHIDLTGRLLALVGCTRRLTVE